MTTYDYSVRGTRECARVTHARRPSPDGLAVKAASGMGWNLAGYAVRAGVGFGINILLARLLGPAPFGLVAVAMVVIALGNLLVESGLGIQLIQSKTLSARLIRGVFTLQIMFGVVMAAGVILCTPLITGLLRQEAVGPVLRAMAVMLVVISAGQTSTALLKRDLRFKAIQQIQIVSYLVGYGALGIPLARAGAGVWALVWGQLTQAVLCTVLSWVLVRHSLVPYIGAESARLLRLGSVLAGSNVVSWSIGALPTFLVGRTLGVTSLGLYNRAYMLVGVPLTALASSLQSVSLSLYSRLQENESTVRRAFLAIIALVALVAFPCFLLVACTAGTVIHAVLGNKWSAAAPLLFPLAFAMPFDAIAAVSSSLLISRGRPGLDFYTQAITAVSGASALAVVGLTNPTLLSFGWTVCCCFYVLRALTAAVFVKRVLRIPWHTYAAAPIGGAALGALAMITAGAVDIHLASWAAWPRLLFAWAAGLSAAGAVAAVFPERLLHRDLIWLLTDRGLPIPAGVDKWLRSIGSRRLPSPVL